MIIHAKILTDGSSFTLPSGMTLLATGYGDTGFGVLFAETDVIPDGQELTPVTSSPTEATTVATATPDASQGNS